MTKIILGIESTAHTFGVSLVDSNGKILCNVKDSYTTEHGGMHPPAVFDHHIQTCTLVLNLALRQAKLKLRSIDIIAYSRGPGLGNALRVGAFIARFLSSRYNIPLVGVDHCIAHLEIGNLITKCKDPVMLYVSGANTQVIAYDSGRYRIFGETLDQGIGNLLDSFARHLGLGFPGGPKISALADKWKYKQISKKHAQPPGLIFLPYSVKGMDVNFGGILTNLKQKFATKKFPIEQLCYSLQETVFAMMVEIAERALAHCEKEELLLAGGVACNDRLVDMCKIMCQERDAKLFVPDKQYLLDNAAMIAWTGWLQFKAGDIIEPHNATAQPYERTDEVEVKWRM